jgi:hypothetical protein
MRLCSFLWNRSRVVMDSVEAYDRRKPSYREEYKWARRNVVISSKGGITKNWSETLLLLLLGIKNVSRHLLVCRFTRIYTLKGV